MTGRLATPSIFTAREALVCVVLWGVIVSVLQASNEAARALSFRDYERLLTSLLMTFVPSGAAWNLALLWIERTCASRFGLAVAITASIALAALVNVAITRFESQLGLAKGIANMLGGQPELDGQFLHVLWLNAFFGGLYSLGFVLHQRSARQRLALRDVQIRRSQSEGLLRQAQLDRLRIQIQPRLLLEVLGELRRRYAAPSRRAERLLDMAVAFLRAARSSLRDERSTLRDELALARGYFDLCDEIGFMSRRWRLSVRAPAPDVAFPSLMLLALIEPIARSAPRGSEITLHGEPQRDGGLLLRLSSSPSSRSGWLVPELEFRMLTSLRALCGERVEVLLDADRRSPEGTLGLLVHGPDLRSPQGSAEAQITEEQG